MNMNLDIWEKAEKVDPAATRPFQRGGFSGTAISPNWMAKKATELFGPCGIGWGYEIVNEKYMKTLPIVKDGIAIGSEITHVLRVRLWYMQGTQKGSVEHFGQTIMVGMRNGFYFSDEDAPKKSLTDAIGKCLSMLGFGAEIYAGFHDDSKYADSQSASVPASASATSGKVSGGSVPVPEKVTRTGEETKQLLQATKKRLAECDLAAIQTARVMAKQMFEGKDLEDFMSAVKQREAELAATTETAT